MVVLESISSRASDANAAVVIVDLPDANPADVLVDFLTNPFYGTAQFDPSFVANMSIYRTYCLAAGLLVSPTITSQGAINSFLLDLMKATNSEIVWNSTQLTVVPWGDTVITANGVTYTPPSQPIYSLTDTDFLSPQGTNPYSVGTAPSDDPVTVTRLDILDQENDILVEYLDRANIYNPAIVEAKNEAAIELFGVKNKGPKTFHMFCNLNSALMGANLLLGRQQIRRTFIFTVGREYILLDPMDIVAITDVNLGLNYQWVRLKEITENDDRSLSMTAEEYLQGTATAPLYAHQQPAGLVQNYNALAPSVMTPIIFDAPVQISGVLGMETVICTNASGGVSQEFGGADVYLSSDNVTFAYAATLYGGTVMGVTTATFGMSGGTVTTTLSTSMGISDGTLTVASDSGFPTSGDYTIQIGSEDILVQAGQGTTTWTDLYRGFNGTTAATHASGATVSLIDPDQTNTLSVDLTDCFGILMPGTQNDADQANTLCLVDNELVSYEQATLTSANKYNLGKNGGTAGYLRRGIDGTTIASHAFGAPFARLRAGSYVTVPYNASQIGQTIYAKFISFNGYGGGKGSLANAVSYSHILAAPPAISTGLLAGIIQTPDLTLNAATGQTSASSFTGGAIDNGTYGTVGSASYTSSGSPIEISGGVGLNNTVLNGAVCIVKIVRNLAGTPVTVWGPAPIVVPSNSTATNTTATVNFNVVDTPTAAIHTYTIEAEGNGADFNWTSFNSP